jgi:drug/metabolite transporter (DMT)-like permease
MPADLLLLAIVLLWSFNFTAVRYAVSHGFQPLAYASVRWTVAALVYAGVAWRVEGSLRVSKTRPWPARPARRLRAVDQSDGPRVCGQARTRGDGRAPLRNTPCLHRGPLPDRGGAAAAPSGMGGIGVSFAGVSLIAAGGSGKVSAHAGGVVLAVVTAATFAAYSVGVVKLMRRYSPYRISALTACIGALLLLAK